MSILIVVVIAPLLLVDLVFIAEVILGLRPLRAVNLNEGVARTVIVVPAHNEALGIAKFLMALGEAAGDRFGILLVADNCTDDTANLSRQMGVSVVERRDQVRRGKGFALDYAKGVLRADPPEQVIILDADCFVSEEGLIALAGAANRLRRPVQAVYLLEPANPAGSMVQLSCFAFLIRNLVRQRGLQRLGDTVHLTGTGMCLPWRLFEKADLATGSIVEDAQLGLELARAGARPCLVEECIVWSPHADQSHTLGQRSRWEGGFLALARANAPQLIGRGLTTLSPRMLLSGLDLLVPPLALLAMINVAVLAVLIVLAVFGITSLLPVLLIGGIGLAAALALLLAWWREGRAFLSPGALLRLPLYALWKIPMYLKLARGGTPKQWKRTERS